MRVIVAAAVAVVAVVACATGGTFPGQGPVIVEGGDAGVHLDAGTIQIPALDAGMGGGQASATMTPGATATANLVDGTNKPVGTAKLTQTAHGVLIDVEVRDLKPGTHAIHLHETGKCEGPAFKTAGGHFNPSHKQHGFMLAEGAHGGDLPNIDVAATGAASAELMAHDVSIDSLLDADGAAIVVHANPDDYKSQPAGNAGDRIACGVIQR